MKIFTKLCVLFTTLFAAISKFIVPKSYQDDRFLCRAGEVSEDEFTNQLETSDTPWPDFHAQ